MSKFKTKVSAAAAVAAITSAIPATAFAATAPGPGYRFIGQSGVEYAFSTSSSTPTVVQPNVPVPTGNQVVAAAANPVGPGHWLLLSSGGVLAEGGATWYGSPAAQFHTSTPASTPVGIAALPDGLGYYVLFQNGSVFNYGAATWKGSPYQAYGGHPGTPSMIGIAATSTGYLVLGGMRDGGGVHNYGTPWYGSPRASHVVNYNMDSGVVNAPERIAAAPNGGYYVLGAHGSVWAYNAPWYGSPYQQHGQNNVSALLAVSRSGTGYRIAATVGGDPVYAYGSDNTGTCASNECPSPPFTMNGNNFVYYEALLPGA